MQKVGNFGLTIKLTHPEAMDPPCKLSRKPPMAKGSIQTCFRIMLIGTGDV